MSFLWPIMLPFLVLLPLTILYYAQVQRRRRKTAARLGSLAMLRDERGGRPGGRRHVPAVMMLTGLTVMLCALARPEAPVSIPKLEGTVVLAFDVSKSMAAQDILPSRMEAAKEVARDLVARQPASLEIGIVAFSEGGLSVQAPTTNREQVAAAIERLSPEGGTSLGRGILEALNAVSIAAGEPPPFVPGATPSPTRKPVPAGSNRSAVIVLLTDGENNARPDPILTAQTAAQRGVRIHTVGIGSPAGSVLTVEGFSVHTQLDEAVLKRIAEITDGEYYNAQSAEDLREIFTRIEPQAKLERETLEVTSYLAGASLVLLLIGGLLSLLWFYRMP